jgi:hypothetical protein
MQPFKHPSSTSLNLDAASYASMVGNNACTHMNEMVKY